MCEVILGQKIECEVEKHIFEMQIFNFNCEILRAILFQRE
jgi:hypothetical protein